MSYELILISVVAASVVLLGIGQLVTFVAMMREFREVSRTHRAIAGLVVQESDKIRELLRV